MLKILYVLNNYNEVLMIQKHAYCKWKYNDGIWTKIICWEIIGFMQQLSAPQVAHFDYCNNP